MKKKVTSLTQEQIDKFDDYVAKWIDVGTDCSELDLEKCKHYARIAYKNADLTCPEEFIVADGPTDALNILEKHGIDRSEALNGFVFGQHEASWLSFYDYIQTELDVDCSLLEGIVGLAKHCGWWYPTDEFVLFVKKHTAVHFDANNLAHNESGPAIEYADGTKIWVINGVRVNEQIVMRPETLTVKQINKEDNLDVRAIMINRYGWHNYLAKSKASLVDFRENDVENTKEALYTTKEFGKRLVVTCPTGRIFTLGVPENVSNCEQAQNWLGNDTSKKFNVIGRT